MTADIAVPESVLLYATDSALRTAVNTLLDDGLPPGLERHDLPNYYAALIAAQRFQSDWGAFGHALWEATWGAALADQRRWTMSAISVVAEKWGILPSNLWLDGEPFFGWIVEDGRGHSLWTGLVLNGAGLRVVVDTDFGKPDPYAVLAERDQPCERSSDDNWLSPALTSISGGTLDVMILLQEIAALLLIIDNWSPPVRKRRD